MSIDAATRKNLELMQTLSGEKHGSLFKAIDLTVSNAGARLLSERMMSPSISPEEISRRQDSIAYLLDRPELAARLLEATKQLPDMPRALSRLALNRGGPRDLQAISKGLEIGGMIREALGQPDQLPEEFASVATRLEAVPEALSKLLQTALGDELPLLMRDGGFVRAGFEPELDELRKLRDDSRRIIAQMQADYAAETGVKSLKIRHNNVLGYFIEVTANNAAALSAEDHQAKFIHRQTLANSMRFTTGELAEIESRIAEAAGKAQQIEERIFHDLVTATLEQSGKINGASEAAAIADVSQGLARLAEKHDYCRPKVDNSLEFSVTGGRHPVVEQVLSSGDQGPFVSNDCAIGAEDGSQDGKLWLLTGPNMGGKSTFLRQNALIAILAQMGAYVPASSAHIGIVDRMFSRVGAADDLARGRSTFMVEMVETAAILNQAGSRAFVILDEIGRGTSTFDGLSIAWATIEHLHEVNQCRTLFATHFHELTLLAEPLERLSNVTMRVKEWKGEVVFLHEVTAGTADRSYGIQVAKLAGLPEPVIARARDVLERLESSKQDGASNRLIDDLPLFSAQAAANPPPSGSQAHQQLLERLKNLTPDELSPREALALLYELRAMYDSES